MSLALIVEFTNGKYVGQLNVLAILGVGCVIFRLESATAGIRGKTQEDTAKELASRGKDLLKISRVALRNGQSARPVYSPFR